MRRFTISNRIDLSLTSPGTTVVRLRAVDRDAGDNGHVRYRFSQRSAAGYGDVFGIDPESGDVVLLHGLNHARQPTYSLGVIAEDLGEYSVPAAAALLVTVLDVNDHAPRITVEAWSDSGTVEVSRSFLRYRAVSCSVRLVSW